MLVGLTPNLQIVHCLDQLTLNKSRETDFDKIKSYKKLFKRGQFLIYDKIMSLFQKYTKLSEIILQIHREETCYVNIPLSLNKQKNKISFTLLWNKGDLKNVYLDFLIFFLYMVVALIKAVEDYEVQNPITKWELKAM